MDNGEDRLIWPNKKIVPTKRPQIPKGLMED